MAYEVFSLGMPIFAFLVPLLEQAAADNPDESNYVYTFYDRLV